MNGNRSGMYRYKHTHDGILFILKNEILSFVTILMIAILKDIRLNFMVVLICIFLIINDIEYFFPYVLAICVSSLEKYLFRSSTHFKIRFCLDTELYEIFDILNINL